MSMPNESTDRRSQWFDRLANDLRYGCRALKNKPGFAAVAIESQHGLWDTAGILAGIAAVRQGGAAPIVRVPLGDFAMVSRSLDFGRSSSAAGGRTAP